MLAMSRSAPADLLEFLVLPQPVKFIGRGVIERDGWERSEVRLGSLKPPLGTEHVGPVSGPENKRKATFQSFDPRDPGDRHVVYRLSEASRDPRVSRGEQAERVRVQEDHFVSFSRPSPWKSLYDPSSVIGRPRRL